MKKQRIKGIVLVVVCFICVLCICSGFYRVQSKELSEIPDAVNSTRFNTTEHLTVVANQEEIADHFQVRQFYFLSIRLTLLCFNTMLQICYQP